MSKIVLNKASTVSFNKAFQREKKTHGSLRTNPGHSRSNSRVPAEKITLSKYEPVKLRRIIYKPNNLSESVSGSHTSQNISIVLAPERNSINSDRQMMTRLHFRQKTVQEPILSSVYDQIHSKMVSRPKPEFNRTLRSFSPGCSGLSSSSLALKSFRESLNNSRKVESKKPSTGKKEWPRVSTSSSTVQAENQVSEFKQSLAIEFREAVHRCLRKEKAATNMRKPSKKLLEGESVSIREYQLKGIHKLITFFDQDPVLKQEKEQYRSNLQEFKKVAISHERKSSRSTNDRFKIKGILGNSI